MIAFLASIALLFPPVHQPQVIAGLQTQIQPVTTYACVYVGDNPLVLGCE